MKILARRPPLALPVRVALGAAFAILFGAPGCSHGSLVGSCLGLSEFTNCKGGPVDNSVPCGGGTAASCESEADCPASKSPCGKSVCDKGVCSIEPAEPKGTSCDDHGGKTCDGDGNCVECLASTDCRNETACVKTTCSAEHACETSNEKQGEACSDHDGTVCDGVGKCVACNVETDCTEPSTKCLELSGCTDHQCTTTKSPTGTSCADRGGNICDDDGRCFGAMQATIGGGHACAVTTLGAATCWGQNLAGAIGDGTTDYRTFPTPVSGLTKDVEALVAGSAHTCALLSGGKVDCWGDNTAGELGTGDTTAHLTPVTVSGLVGKVAAIAAYGVFDLPGGQRGDTCALLSSGSVSCWGTNDSMKFGVGSSPNQLSPRAVTGLSSVLSLAIGRSHMCAVMTGGSVKCLGGNGVGQLGDGSNDASTSPVDVALTSVASIAAGRDHTCAISGGFVACWGANDKGQLGDGSNTASNVPLFVETSAKQVAAGDMHTCVVTAAGGASCWGSNASGQLGDGTNTDRTAPVAVTGLSTGVAFIAAGSQETCAVLDGGEMKCWGAAAALGDGSGVDQSTPVALHGL